MYSYWNFMNKLADLSQCDQNEGGTLHRLTGLRYGIRRLDCVTAELASYRQLVSYG